MSALWLWLALASAQEPAAEAAPAENTEASESTEEVVEEESEVVDPLLGRAFEATEPGQTSPDDPHWAFEVMYHKGQYKECETQALEQWRSQQDPYAAFHAARCQFHLGEEMDLSANRSEKIAYYTEMVAMLDQAVAKKPDDRHLKFARAVATARLGTSRGVLASLRLATDIEGAWLDVANSDYRYASIDGEEVLPCDAKYSLGVFYRLVPDWRIIQLLAGTRGDLDKSIDYLNQANRCRPNTIRYLKELAVAKLCKWDKTGEETLKTEAIAHINAYMGIAPGMETEVIDIRHGALLLQNPKMACEYSRDGQQQLDRKKLE